MCGLIWAKSKDEKGYRRAVNKTIIKQYYNQQLRGVEGFGVYDGQHQHLIKEVTERRILKWLINKNHSSTEILFHHRYPTSTKNVKNAAHPFSTKDFFGDTEYILIHNGIINNPTQLQYKQSSDFSIEYESVQKGGEFNDSEALLWDIALTLSGLQEKPLAVGSVAFICIEKHNDDPSKNVLHYYRNTGKPLYVCDNNKFRLLASQPTTGQNARLIQPDTLYTFDYASEMTTQKDFSVALDYKQLPDKFEKSYEGAITDFKKSNYYKSYQPKKQPIVPTEPEIISAEEIEDLEKTADEAEYDRQVALFSDTRQMQKDFKETVLQNLIDTDGFYQNAIDNMRTELVKLNKMPYNIEKWYKMEVLRGAIAILIADPFWNANDSAAIHPDFMEREENKNQERLALHSDASTEIEDITLAVEEKYKKDTDLNTVDKILHNDRKPADRSFTVGEVLDKKISSLFSKKKVPSLIKTYPER